MYICMMRYSFISTRMALIKNTDNNKQGEDAEKLKPLGVASGNVKQYGMAAVENRLAVLQEVKH